MRVPDEVRDTVVFVGSEGQRDGQPAIIWRGTAFVVAIPSSRADFNFEYFVTARHVVAPLQGQRYFIRANRVDDGSVVTRGDGRETWWFHPTDSSADVAVLPIGINRNVYKLTAIPIQMFLKDPPGEGQSHIGVGDDVFITGLFAHLSGDERNHPIVRTGNVALMPSCKVETAKFGKMDAYLIEARSIGGISGSPVFVRETKMFAPRTPFFAFGKIHLIGLMHGHWDLPPSAKNDVVGDDIMKSVNMGIAIVVPAHKIIETLEQPELVEQRKELEAHRAAKMAQTPD